MHKYTIGSDSTISSLNYVFAQNTNIASDEIEIEVRYSGLGMIDALQVSGAMGNMEGHTPGLEVEGIVSEVGSKVTRFRRGDRVAAMCFGGGFASHVVTQEYLAAQIPGNQLTPGFGAVCIVNSLTAWGALTIAQSCGAFNKVLVHAATGGLGSQFGQVARMFGAHQVDAVVGNDEKEKIAHDLGYHNVWRRQQPESIPTDTYDVAIDMVGGDATAMSWDALASGGRIVKVGNASNAEPVPLDSLKFWFENKSILGFNVGSWILEDKDRTQKAIQWCVDRTTDNSLIIPLEVFPQSDITLALEKILDGSTSGKVAIEWAGDTTR